MGDLVPFDGWRSVVEQQLAELNDRAATELDVGEPAPDGLPPAGSWIRVVKVDDDAHGKPLTPWHYVVGWDGYIGCLSTRCRRRPGQDVSIGLDVYLGTPSAYGRRPWTSTPWERGRVLLVEPDRPDEGACRQCDASLARDGARLEVVAREMETERLLKLLPAVQAIAADPSIDDAERGRRIRALWPVVGV